MDSLTDEQRERIARNREEALRRLEERKRRLAQEASRPPTTAPPPSTSAAPAPTTSTAAPATKSNFAWPVGAFKKPTETYSLFSNAAKRPAGGGNVAAKQPAPSNSANTAYASSANQRSVVKVNFIVMNDKYVKVNFTPFNLSVVETLKTIPSRHYNEFTKIWSIGFADYEPLVAKLRALHRIRVEIDELPHGVKMVFRDEICGRSQPSTANRPPSLSGLDDEIVSALFPYQKRGVMFGIEKGGRVLIADEMGLGKSVQALAIAQKFSAEWPLLIICPSSVKSAWQNQVKKFLPSISAVYMIDKGSDVLPKSRSTSTIVIMSYDQMSIRIRELLEHSFYVVIFDESHLLKEMKSKRTKCAIDLSKKAIRVILLSGTPALSRPVELYPQVKIINPKIFTNLQQFGVRYCDGKQGRFAFEMKGATNTEELVAILHKTIMIRRLKKDVLNDLPAKRREIIYLSGESINHSMKCLKEARQALMHCNKSNKDKRECLMQYYVETGIVKSHSVAHHIVENYFYEGAERRKILIFAHHSIVLDTVTSMIARKGIKFIRIDGSTPQKERGRLCEEFQTKEDVLVAILSITAAGVGITLTAASVVVFAELHWNPGSMLQAEDRAHRVGQQDSVLVQYMLAKNTADDEIWPLVEKKLKMLGSVSLSNDSYKDAENLHRDCSDRAITSYFERLAESSTKSANVDRNVALEEDDLEILDGEELENKKLNAEIEVTEADELEILGDDVFEKNPSKPADRCTPEEIIEYDIEDEDKVEVASVNDLTDTFDATGMSRCGGFEIEDDEEVDWIEDPVIEESVPKRCRR